MIPPGALFHKPKSIIAAKNILYACIFLAIVSSLVGEFSSGLLNYTSLQGLITSIVTFVVLFIIARNIGLGRKWARTLFLILFILWVLAMPMYATFIFRASLVLGFLLVLQSGLQIMALAFLFNNKSSLWFNGIKESNDKLIKET
jgi:hypothetical protein